MSTSQKPLFRLVLAASSYLLVEAGAWLCLSASAGKLASFPELSRQRASVAAISRDYRSVRDAAPSHVIAEKEVLHPYLGYVDLDLSRPAVPRRNEFEFADGRPLFQAPAKDEIVIAVTGASVAGKLAGEYRAVLREELKKIDQFRDRRISVIALALGGYKQPQQYFALAYYLVRGARFDLVVNLDGFNDVALPLAQNYPHGVYPGYPRNWYYRVADHLIPELQALQARKSYLQSLRIRGAGLVDRAPLRYSFLAHGFWRLWDRLLERESSRLDLQASLFDAGQRSFVRDGPGKKFADAREVLEESVRIWMRSSVQMKMLSDGYGIRYYHFLQPNQYDLGSKPLTPVERKDAWREDHPYAPGARAGYPLLRAQAPGLLRSGVKFHDLSRVFADSHEDYYMDTCCHVNEAGDRVLARAIAAAIQADLKAHPARFSR
ncbi:MAG: hypothetical protein ACHQ2Z_07715 [Elusimicrobiota bacterium]